MKRYTITSDGQRKELRMGDLMDANPGKTVGLACAVQASVRESYLKAREKKAAEEAEKKPNLFQDQQSVRASTPTLSRSGENQSESSSKGIKYHI